MSLYVYIYFIRIISFLLFCLFVCFFFIKNLYFFHFHFFFSLSIEFPQQHINQSEIEIDDKKLSVELYVIARQKNSKEVEYMQWRFLQITQNGNTKNLNRKI